MGADLDLAGSRQENYSEDTAHRHRGPRVLILRGIFLISRIPCTEDESQILLANRK